MFNFPVCRTLGFRIVFPIKCSALFWNKGVWNRPVTRVFGIGLYVMGVWNRPVTRVFGIGLYVMAPSSNLDRWWRQHSHSVRNMHQVWVFIIFYYKFNSWYRSWQVEVRCMVLDSDLCFRFHFRCEALRLGAKSGLTYVSCLRYSECSWRSEWNVTRPVNSRNSQTQQNIEDMGRPGTRHTYTQKYRHSPSNHTHMQRKDASVPSASKTSGTTGRQHR